MCGSISGLSCLSLFQYDTVLITVASNISGNWVMQAGANLLLFQNCLDYSKIFEFPYKFKNQLDNVSNL